MSNFLYGAAVNGIQDFIFKTNKLKEIVGASEIVEQICTTFFENECVGFNNENSIISAAGNIKYIFNNEQECKEFCLDFPKKVSEFAPGITLTQAVVKLKNETPSGDEINVLENKLKVQRNILPSPIFTSYMGVERERRTGDMAVHYEGDVAVSLATQKKIKIHENQNNSINSLFKKINITDIKPNEFALEISNITKSDANSWIAVIHADGNGLGNILQNEGKNLNDKNKFKDFSEAIKTATINAVQKAFLQNVTKQNNIYPFRPLIVGGDDVTVIIRADLALKFTADFLHFFEEESAKEFKQKLSSDFKYVKGITACAGISYIKASYPLHYGLNLAEELCKDAKKLVKSSAVAKKYEDIPKAAIAIYKVQDSFTRDLKVLKEKTMQTQYGLSFYNGPYFIDETEKNNVQQLFKLMQNKEVIKGKGKIRQLITTLYQDKKSAEFMLKRMQEVNKDLYKTLDLEDLLDNNKTLLLDLINQLNF